MYMLSIQENTQARKGMVCGQMDDLPRCPWKLPVDLAKYLCVNDSTILNEPFEGSLVVCEKLGQIKINGNYLISELI